MKLIEIEKRLPTLVYNLHTIGEDGKEAVEARPLTRLTNAARSAATQAFPPPGAAWVQKLADGTKADRPYANTTMPEYSKGEEKQYRLRQAALAAIALGVDIGDPASPGREFSWQSLGPGDRNERRVAYCKAVAEHAIENLTTDEIDAIIAIASGMDVDADGRPIEREDGEAGADDVSELGKPSAQQPEDES